MNQPEDELVVTFWGPFIDKEDGLAMLKEDLTIRKAIPPQIEEGILADTIEATSETLEVGSASVLMSNAFINILLAGSLN